MQFELVSDLHLEMDRERKVFPALGSDVLVVAGDLHVGAANVYRDLVHYGKLYKHIVYVPGNHEYYGSSLAEFNSQLRLLLSKHPNIHFLNNQFVDIDGVRFIGSTLWTNFRYNPLAMMAAKTLIADFKQIKDFTPELSAKEFYQSKEFIKFAYESSQNPKVIVSHFLPATECIHSKYAHENLINNYFSNNLGEWISSLENTVWVYGHSHDPMDIVIGETRLVCNPLGYSPDNSYIPKLINVADI